MAANRPVFDPDRIAGPAPEAVAPLTLTVSHLNAMIKRVVGDHLPGTIHLVGEISNCHKHSSGHLYLTLKDDRSEIRAVMWRSALTGLKFKPADGMEVIATGNVDVYENRGQYQFYIRKLEPRGVGALELAFRQLHERLSREGLFEQKHKKPIPRLPRRIAVVTSPTGAAIRDILNTIQRRCRCVSVMLHPVPVQGDGAAAEIAAAIRRLNAQASRLGGIDVMIVARGGGSLEDLWPFNEEIVARAIFDSTIPIISGVGHEVDTTIADLVADVRAPTPTAAAELAVPVLDELLAMLSAQSARLHRAVRHGVDIKRSRLESLQRAEWFRDPLTVIHRREQQLDETFSRLRLACSHRLAAAHQRLHRAEMRLSTVQPSFVVRRQQERLNQEMHRLRWALLQRIRAAERRMAGAHKNLLLVSPQRRHAAECDRIRNLLQRLDRGTANRLQSAGHVLDAYAARLEGTSYRRTLARGFTITRTQKGRKIITSADAVAPGEKIITETGQGEFESRVTDKQQGELFE